MKRFKKILFVKSENNNLSSFLHAVNLAKSNQAQLTLMDAIGEIPNLSGYGISNETAKNVKQDTLESYRKELNDLATSIDTEVDINIQVLEGKPFLTIIREIIQKDYDLVIKTADGDTWITSQLFCSLGKHLLRKCPCPVWLVKPLPGKKIKRIIAAVDFDDPGENHENEALNKKIIEMAISLAHREGAELHIIHAWEAIAKNFYSSSRSGISELDVENYISETRELHESHVYQLRLKAQGWAGLDTFESVNPKFHTYNGRIQTIIKQQTEKLGADLVVMGTLSRVGIPGFFIGNTAETILNRINCSVLAVKPPGFVSPVLVS